MEYGGIGEKSFINLMSFRQNFMAKSMTEMELRDYLMQMFGNNNESNELFVKSCVIHELCECFQKLLNVWEYDPCFKGMTISTYTGHRGKYILFSSTVPAYDIDGNIMYPNEEAVALFQIRDLGNREKIIRSIVDPEIVFGTLNTDLNNTKCDGYDEIYPYLLQIIGEIKTKILSNEGNKPNDEIMVCKSKIRLAYESFYNLNEKYKVELERMLNDDIENPEDIIVAKQKAQVAKSLVDASKKVFEQVAEGVGYPRRIKQKATQLENEEDVSQEITKEAEETSKEPEHKTSDSESKAEIEIKFGPAGITYRPNYLAGNGEKTPNQISDKDAEGKREDIKIH